MYHKRQEDFEFEKLDGTKIKRKEFMQLILDNITDQNVNVAEVAALVQMHSKPVGNMLRYLVTHEYLISTKTQRYTYYRKPNYCALANMFYDKEAILKNFKIKGKITRKAEDTPNISYRSKLNDYSSNASSCHITNMEEG